MTTLASSLDKFQATSVLLVTLQDLAVSVCENHKEPHSTCMLLLERPRIPLRSQAGSVSEQTQRKTGPRPSVTSLCPLKALPFLRYRVQKALLRDRADHEAAGPRGWKPIFMERRTFFLSIGLPVSLGPFLLPKKEDRLRKASVVDHPANMQPHTGPHMSSRLGCTQQSWSNTFQFQKGNLRDHIGSYC